MDKAGSSGRRSISEFRRQEEEVIGSLCNMGTHGNVSPKAQIEQEKRIRREIANSNERRRMQSINAGFQSLRVLLPQKDGEKMSKASILQHTAEYIVQIEHDKTRLMSINLALRRLLEQNGIVNYSESDNLDSGGGISGGAGPSGSSSGSGGTKQPQKRRRGMDSVESADEGIGMSPSHCERELISDLRYQLERERELRRQSERRVQQILSERSGRGSYHVVSHHSIAQSHAVGHEGRHRVMVTDHEDDVENIEEQQEVLEEAAEEDGLTHVADCAEAELETQSEIEVTEHDACYYGDVKEELTEEFVVTDDLPQDLSCGSATNPTMSPTGATVETLTVLQPSVHTGLVATGQHLVSDGSGHITTVAHVPSSGGPMTATGAASIQHHHSVGVTTLGTVQLASHQLQHHHRQQPGAHHSEVTVISKPSVVVLPVHGVNIVAAQQVTPVPSPPRSAQQSRCHSPVVAASSGHHSNTAATSRQNLDTIVEAIRHLEGDHMFGHERRPSDSHLMNRRVLTGPRPSVTSGNMTDLGARSETVIVRSSHTGTNGFNSSSSSACPSPAAVPLHHHQTVQQR